MEPCLFAQNFWGEKNSGFDVLYQNLKLSCRSTSDFAEFVRDSSSIEDAYYKSLLKLAKQTGSYSNNNHGSFKPCWTILRQFVEQLGQLHLAFAQNRQSLSKDVQKYLEEQQKRHKSIRDAEASTQEVVHAFQVTAIQLQRAKEVYHSRYADYQRTISSESSSTREQEKMEAKLKKAQDEYKYSVEKYNNLRNQFVSKMSASCAQFQEVEVAHLEQMREFMQRYSSVWSTARDTIDNLCAQFNENLCQITTTKLLELFIKDRGTGTLEPQGVPFEDAEVAAVFSPNADPPGGTIRAIDVFNNEQRASSALAVVGSTSKENGNVSQNSLTDLSADAVSLASGSLAAVPSGNTSTGTASNKRREGFFRRRRNSLTQEPGLSDSTTVAGSIRVGNQIGGSLSAFNVVAKRGIRRLGTPLSNGKDKWANKQDSKSASSLTEDWRVATSSELPKDEEGFTIRPSDPWGEPASGGQSDNGQSDSDSEVDVVGRTFKGLKVNIRPPGDFVPGVATLPSPKKPSPNTRRSNTTRLSVRGGQNLLLVDTRGNKRGSSESSAGTDAQGHSDSNAVTNLLQVLSTAPALPPPPSVTGTGPSDDWSFIMDSKDSKASLVRPRASGAHTWSRMDSVNPPSDLILPTPVSGEQTTINSKQSVVSKRLNLDLMSLDPLFSPKLPTGKSMDSDPSFSHAWDVGGSGTAGSNDTVTPTKRFDTSATIRRCASAVPDSTLPNDESHVPEKGFSQLNWQPFGMEPAGTVWNSNSKGNVDTNSLWPTHSTGAFSQFPNFSTFDPKLSSERSTPTQSAPLTRVDSKISTQQGSAMSIPSLGSATVSPFANALSSGPIFVAAAFTEMWRARFHNGGGSSFSTASMITPPPIQAVSGELVLAFPRIAIEQCIAKSTVGPLVLRLNNAVRFKDIQLKVVGSSMVGCPLESALPMTTPSTGITMDYVLTIPGSVLMDRFVSLLHETASMKFGSNGPATNPNASYLKLDILSYNVDVGQGSEFAPYSPLSPPIHLCTYWRCDQLVTDFRLDYATRWPNDAQMTSRTGRGDLRINLNVDGGVSRMQSLPMGTWTPELNRATWQIPLTFSTSDGQQNSSLDGSIDSSGTVRAKFTLEHGPGRPQPVALQFFREECLASGVQLVLDCADYRLSLCKRRIIGDRYVCDPPNHSTRFQLHPLPSVTKPTVSAARPCSPSQTAPGSHPGNERWTRFPTSASNET